MIYIIAFLIFIIIAIILIIKLKSHLKLFNIVLILTGCLLIILGIASGICCINYYLTKKNFHSFDLAELKRQEFIIQTIDFKKFLIQGTENDNQSKYTNELQVYLISGQANICFKDIEKLKIDEESSDINTKTLRLNYNNPLKKIPFDIDIIISENDIYKVSSFNSESVDILGYKIDLIKPKMTQAEKVEVSKKYLKEEFEKQIIDNSSKKKLNESDLYQIFLTQLTEFITSMSDWKTVEVNFTNNRGE